MKLETYKYKGNVKDVNKKLGDADRTIDNCAWLENTDMLHPVVTFNNISDSASILNENYCYIPHWGRYYFIDSIEYLLGGVIALHLSIDVLNTFKKDILNSTQLIGRAEKFYNKKLIDSNMPVQVAKKLTTFKASNSELFNIDGAGTTLKEYLVMATNGYAS